MYTADITHLKEKDQEKRKIVEILEKTNEVARIGTWEVNIVKNKITWSKVTREIHETSIDYEPELSTAIDFFKEGESRNKIQMAVSQAIANGTPYDLELELVTAKGNSVWVRSIGQAEFEKGTCKRLYGVFHDINERKISEEALYKANAELKAIFNSDSISIIGTNLEGVITHFNQGAEKLLQYLSTEMIGKQTPMLIHIEEEIVVKGQQLSELRGKKIEGFNVFAELAINGANEPHEWTYVRKDGSLLTVQLIVTALKNSKGDITSFLGFATDISEKSKNQKEILEAKTNLELLTDKLHFQNKQLANFAHITSHNLRSPVSNLNSLLHLYKVSESEQEKSILFDKFETVINHLSSTLNSLVEALKIKQEANKDIEEITFDEILKKVTEIISGQIIETKTKINSDFSKVKLIKYNKNYLESIFLNLLTNAIKYKSPDRDPEIIIKTGLNNGKITLTVNDNGLGIDLARHGNKLFGLHKTFHRHAEAKGVGLYLTKTQVESMGGTITASSDLNKGTTFKILFN